MKKVLIFSVGTASVDRIPKLSAISNKQGVSTQSHSAHKRGDDRSSPVKTSKATSRPNQNTSKPSPKGHSYNFIPTKSKNSCKHEQKVKKSSAQASPLLSKELSDFLFEQDECTTTAGTVNKKTSSSSKDTSKDKSCSQKSDTISRPSDITNFTLSLDPSSDSDVDTDASNNARFGKR